MRLRKSLNDSASAVRNVVDRAGGQWDGQAEHAGARGLVANVEVEGAHLVDAVGADVVEDVEERVVLRHPRRGLGQARRDEIDAVSGFKSEAAVFGRDDVGALVHVDLFVVHVDAAAHGWVLRGVVTGHEVVPGVVRNVVRAAGLVDVQESHGAIAVADFDAHAAAAWETWPVGDAVGVDLATENANGGAVLVVRSDRDGGGRRHGGSEAEDGGESELHFVW